MPTTTTTIAKPSVRKPKDKKLTYSEQLTQKLRVAVYPDKELLEKLDNFCKETNRDRNSAIKHIIRVMLNVDDGSDSTVLSNCITMLEEQLKRLNDAEMAENNLSAH